MPAIKKWNELQKLVNANGGRSRGMKMREVIPWLKARGISIYEEEPDAPAPAPPAPDLPAFDAQALSDAEVHNLLNPPDEDEQLDTPDDTPPSEQPEDEGQVLDSGLPREVDDAFFDALYNMSMERLRNMVRQRGIAGADTMNRADLIEHILHYDAHKDDAPAEPPAPPVEWKSTPAPPDPRLTAEGVLYLTPDEFSLCMTAWTAPHRTAETSAMVATRVGQEVHFSRRAEVGNGYHIYRFEMPEAIPVKVLPGEE